MIQKSINPDHTCLQGKHRIFEPVHCKTFNQPENRKRFLFTPFSYMRTTNFWLKLSWTECSYSLDDLSLKRFYYILKLSSIFQYEVKNCIVSKEDEWIQKTSYKRYPFWETEIVNKILDIDVPNFSVYSQKPGYLNYKRKSKLQGI